MPFCKKLDCDVKNEPPYLATTLLKNSILSYKENFQDTQKIWIEFDWPNPKFGQNEKKIQAHKI
jgi:hypothetical protein